MWIKNIVWVNDVFCLLEEVSSVSKARKELDDLDDLDI
jgi:hypothetical protein